MYIDIECINFHATITFADCADCQFESITGGVVSQDSNYWWIQGNNTSSEKVAFWSCVIRMS